MQELKEQITQALKDIARVDDVQIKKYRTIQGSYFNTHDDLFDPEEMFERVQDINPTTENVLEYIRENYEIDMRCDVQVNDDFMTIAFAGLQGEPLGTVVEFVELTEGTLLDESEREDLDAVVEYMHDNWTLQMFQDAFPEVSKALLKDIDKKLDECADGHSDDEFETMVSNLYGADVDEIRSELHGNAMEGLAFWTVYFEPPYMDRDIATQCELIAFTYERPDNTDLELLALGGCGMDLSPKLDAYQALLSNTLPADSKLIRDPGYSEYVLGEKTYNAALKSAAYDRPRLVISGVLPQDEAGVE